MFASALARSKVPVLRLARLARIHAPNTRIGRTYATGTRPNVLGGNDVSIALFAGCLISTLVGYGLARRKYDSQSAPVSKDTQANEGAKAGSSQYGSEEDFRHAIEELQVALAGAVSTDASDADGHGNSLTIPHDGRAHKVVVYPTCTEDVVKVVKIANKYRTPVIPYSGGTSLEGHFVGSEAGSICVDVSRMDKILEVHEADGDMVVQPGIGWMEVNEYLEDNNLDPAPTATIGGMLSTGCSGTNAVRYGTAKAEWFLNATVVLPSGEVIKTRRRSRKSSAGWDVTKLFIGAEGTLGIVTEVTIRLAPRLPTNVAIVQFPNVRNASEAVIEILNHGVGIQCIELCDSAFMDATNRFGGSSRSYAVADHLFIKMQGSTPRALEETASIVQQVAANHGGSNWMLAKDREEADSMWSDRKNAAYVGLMWGGAGCRGWSTDVCVPISKLPQLVYDTLQDVQSTDIKCTMVGHAGDGNFHTMLCFKNDEELKTVKELVHRMVHRAIELDGTCTGEHGVGIGKREYLVRELGEGTVRLMKTVKNAIDPLNLFNPGKLYPDDDDDRTSDH
ncbi:FAD-binding domain-containing protein [Vararia minispora EC-137]|uniref:FAD-binding domain-containing protein n=1 Tax=Vararia minispora EC-137 TaxID=1314806 RepID=A0ACB8QMB7_9AGAM|nr:FAD-binding domain-containing protein [Vararia minispora EC-137]